MGFAKEGLKRSLTEEGRSGIKISEPDANLF